MRSKDLELDEIISWYDGIVQGLIRDRVHGHVYFCALYFWSRSGCRYYLMVPLNDTQEREIRESFLGSNESRVEERWTFIRRCLATQIAKFEGDAWVVHSEDILQSVTVDSTVEIAAVRNLLDLDIEEIVERSSSSEYRDLLAQRIPSMSEAFSQKTS